MMYTGIMILSSEISGMVGVMIGMLLGNYLRENPFNNYRVYKEYVFHPPYESQWFPTWLMHALTTPIIMVSVHIALSKMMSFTMEMTFVSGIFITSMYFAMFAKSQRTMKCDEPANTELRNENLRRSVILGILMLVLTAVSTLIFVSTIHKANYFVNLVILCVMIRNVNEPLHFRYTPTLIQVILWEPIVVADVIDIFVKV